MRAIAFHWHEFGKFRIHYFSRSFTKKKVISKKGSVEKAASRCPWKSCQVAKETTKTTKTNKITAGIFLILLILHAIR